jgi:regulator of sirC expression with transglutaminase-like and TPR domain
MDAIKLNALITLLDDPNEEIFREVEKAIKQLELAAVPYLEKSWDKNENQLFQTRVETIVHQIQYSHIKTELAKWIDGGAEDLLYGSYLVSKFNYPSLEFSWLEAQITEIRKDIWFELSDHLTSLEKVKVVNHIIFDVYKFTRNNINILSAENNYISEVLVTKKGNPISLSVIYSVVCQRLGLPVYGVNLPKNFILCYLDIGESQSRSMAQGEVMFYINPINKGAVLGRKEIEFFLKQQKIQPQPNYFLPIKSNEEIVKRMFNNLLFAYESNNDRDKVNEINELLSMFNQFY